LSKLYFANVVVVVVKQETLIISRKSKFLKGALKKTHTFPLNEMIEIF
jgi:hypothetical protein